MASEATVSKPVLPPLQTPKSANFPSEVVSTPMLSAHPLSAFIRQETDMKTPITPPTAYTDFLKALTPILASPPPSSTLGRSLSNESMSSTSLLSSHSSKSSLSPGSAKRIFSPTSAPHSAPLVGGGSLRRLRIPHHSPLWSPATSNPSATPRTASSLSSAMYSPFSPADWTGRSNGNFDYLATPRSATSKPVSVRSVVTRTVTYKRCSTPTTPIMEPAPKGKRRKTASATPSVMSEDDGKDSKLKLRSIMESEAEKEIKTENEIKVEEQATSLADRTTVAAPVATDVEAATISPSMAPPPLINISPASSTNTSESEMTDSGSSSDSDSGSDSKSASP